MLSEQRLQRSSLLWNGKININARSLSNDPDKNSENNIQIHNNVLWEIVIIHKSKLPITMADLISQPAT